MKIERRECKISLWCKEIHIFLSFEFLEKMELDLGFDGYSPSLQCSKYIRDLLWTTEHHGSRDWYKWLAEMHSIHILTLLGQKPLKSITKQTCSPAEIRNSPTGCCTSAVDKCILYHDAITLCIISWRIPFLRYEHNPSDIQF